MIRPPWSMRYRRPSTSASSHALACLTVHSLLIWRMACWDSGSMEAHLALFMTMKKTVVYATSKESVPNLQTSPSWKDLLDSMGCMEPSTTPFCRSW